MVLDGHLLLIIMNLEHAPSHPPVLEVLFVPKTRKTKLKNHSADTIGYYHIDIEEHKKNSRTKRVEIYMKPFDYIGLRSQSGSRQSQNAQGFCSRVTEKLGPLGI